MCNNDRKSVSFSSCLPDANNKGEKPGDVRSANILIILCTKYPKIFGPAGQLPDANNKGGKAWISADDIDLDS